MIKIYLITQQTPPDPGGNAGPLAATGTSRSGSEGTPGTQPGTPPGTPPGLRRNPGGTSKAEPSGPSEAYGHLVEKLSLDIHERFISLGAPDGWHPSLDRKHFMNIVFHHQVGQGEVRVLSHIPGGFELDIVPESDKRLRSKRYTDFVYVRSYLSYWFQAGAKDGCLVQEIPASLVKPSDRDGYFEH